MNHLVHLVAVRQDTYRDPVVLMRLSRALEVRPGVLRALCLMATPRNLETLTALKMAPDAWPASPRSNDLVVAVESDDETLARDALAEVDDLLESLSRRRPARRSAPELNAPRTLVTARAAMPDARIAALSVAGAFAAREARKALECGLDVFLFSDGVSAEDEIELKERAESQNLLVMGPDCATSILDGVPFGFANAVRRGPIGLVGASGSGLQEVSSLIHRLGGGVSHVVGTGSRDFTDAVEGRAAQAAIDRLSQDPATRVIVLVATLPSPFVASMVLDRATATGRPVVAVFLGHTATTPRPGVTWALTLEAAAREAVRLAGENVTENDATLKITLPRFAPGQRWLRGLFTGGTLGYEALSLLSTLQVASNLRHPAAREFRGLTMPSHTIVNLGATEFNRGRVHPMIDPTSRVEAVRAVGADPSAAVLLIDLMLGHNAHPDPASVLALSIREARRAHAARGGTLVVVASVTGTAEDPQSRERQVATLTDAGVEVCSSSTSAARRARSLFVEA